MSPEIKPYFRDDLKHILRGVYFASQHGVTDDAVRLGIALVISSLCLVIGIEPDFLHPSDLQSLKNRSIDWKEL